MMGVNSSVNFPDDSLTHAAASPPDKASVIGGLFLGLVGSFCCGGGPVFGVIGLGAFYSTLGIARYMPEALASSAVLMLLLNWLHYRRKASRVLVDRPDCDCSSLRRTALWSTFIALAMMVGALIFLEWLNHGVLHAAHFMHDPSYATAMIPGVPNVHLGYVALAFLVLPVLAMLPFPQKS
jgi:hypothetical protein